MTIHHAAIAPDAATVQDLMREFGVSKAALNESGLIVRSPSNGAAIAQVKLHAPADADCAIQAADAAFRIWRTVPAPKRGELVRLFAGELRARKAALGRLIAIETGKILQEALGEVQEMIDICGFATGLSRQLYGRTMPSERPGHRMMETWHPLGVVGIISAFNFPAAVWAWNATIAVVCGNTLVWKPSEKTPLCALACQALLDRAAKDLEGIPQGLSAVICGGPALGQALAESPLVPLVSATGSTQMGRAIAPRIAARFGRAILELGGNNGAIVTPSADLDLAARAILFAAAGTAGQRCTSLRRLFLHESRYDEFMSRLKADYAELPVGNPLEDGTRKRRCRRASVRRVRTAARSPAENACLKTCGPRPITCARQLPKCRVRRGLSPVRPLRRSSM
jgi:aldehyde dehydrogenase (NAD+)